jgi:hypothetical protein
MEKEADAFLNGLGKDVTELVIKGNRGPFIIYLKRTEETKQSG